MSKNNAKTSRLLEAARKGDLATVSSLLDDKANVDMKGPDGRTALMNAAGGWHLAVVKALLAAKAEVDAKSNSGETACGYALKPDWAGLFGKRGKDELGVVRLLMASGAAVNAEILSYAVNWHDLQVVRALLKGKVPRDVVRDALVKAKEQEYEVGNDPEQIQENRREVEDFLRS